MDGREDWRLGSRAWATQERITHEKVPAYLSLGFAVAIRKPLCILTFLFTCVKVHEPVAASGLKQSSRGVQISRAKKLKLSQKATKARLSKMGLVVRANP